MEVGYEKGKEISQIKEDGHLRNWHLTHFLRKVLAEFRYYYDNKITVNSAFHYYSA